MHDFSPILKYGRKITSSNKTNRSDNESSCIRVATVYLAFLSNWRIWRIIVRIKVSKDYKNFSFERFKDSTVVVEVTDLIVFAHISILYHSLQNRCL